MTSLVKSVLLLALLISVTTCTCVDNCIRDCDIFRATCRLNPVGLVFGIPCEYMNSGCKAACEPLFCPCIENAEQMCSEARQACRTGGAVDVFCQFEFNGCFTTQITQCFGQLGVSILNGILKTLEDVLPTPTK